MEFLKSKKVRFWVSISILAFFLLAIVIYAKHFGSIVIWIWNAISSLVLGGCIAFVINILMSWFDDKVFYRISNPKIARTLSLVCSLLIILIVFVVLILIIVPQLIEALRSLAVKIPGILNYLETELANITSRYPALSRRITDTKLSTSTFSNSISRFLKDDLPKTLTGTFSIVSKTTKSITSIAIAILFSLYLLMYKESLKKQSEEIVYALFNKAHANRIFYIAHLTSDDFKYFIFGRVLDAFIMAVAYLIISLILRLPYSLMITSIIAVFSIIPLFGAIICWGIGFFLIVTVNVFQAIIFSVVILSILFITRNFIYPKLIGDSLGLPDLWVLGAVAIGGKLFGLIGMLTAVPIFSVLYRLFSEFVQRKLKQKDVKVVNTTFNWTEYDPETNEFDKKNS